MSLPNHDIVVAGHICLDLIPRIDTAPPAGQPIVRPGGLTSVGPCTISTGGAVSNTGVALHRLGVPVRLMGRIGDDSFGREVLRILQTQSPRLGDGVKIVAGEITSYTVVISPPHTDRSFLHCPGANDRFGIEDIDLDAIRRARIVHFGYPPNMKRMYDGGGAELVDLMRRLHETGATTSLDMCGIDPVSAAGRVDWRAILAAALPQVDLFLPSIEELLFMLRWPREAASLTPPELRQIADELIGMGAAVVVLKRGELGLYLRTTRDAGRLSAAGRAIAALSAGDWLDRDLAAKCFRIELATATGAGDCAIAGFLAALLRGESPEGALTAAAAVGACCCEAPDATSGVPHWSRVKARIAAGWGRLAD